MKRNAGNVDKAKECAVQPGAVQDTDTRRGLGDSRSTEGVGDRQGSAAAGATMTGKPGRGFFAHLHFPSVSVRSLRFKATWGAGVLLIVCFVILAGSGILLAFAYQPDFQGAYESVWEITFNYPYGRLLRSVHYLAGNLFFLASLLHLLRVIWAGAYSGARYRNYVYGLALLVIGFGALATGYFLPMSEISYWALVVGTRFLDYFPVVGLPVKRLLMGGEEIGDATVVRLYVLHLTILPLVFIGFASLHLWRIRKDQGLLKPISLGPEELRKVSYTFAVRREWMVFLLVVIALLSWALASPVELGPRPAPAYPPNPVKAAWFFVALQETLSYSAFWGGVVPLGVVAAVFLLFPLFAGGRDGYPLLARRKVFSAVALATLLAYAAFTLLGLCCRGPNWSFTMPSLGVQLLLW